MTHPRPRLAGVVLAAGAGTRAGGPKALRRDAGGTPWVELATRALVAGGCAEVVVVLGAGADAARPLVPADARVVVAPDWAEGMSASLRAGLAATDADVVVVTLGDLPGLPAGVVARVLGDADRTTLRRAVFAGRPGHPVVIGRDHVAAVAASAHGDRGAGPYLRAHDAEPVECADLWDGADVDGPGSPAV